MSEELKLLACPFCGGRARVVLTQEIICEGCGNVCCWGNRDESIEMWNRRDTTAVQREREECAKVAEGHPGVNYDDGNIVRWRLPSGREIAAAIRARGE